jgi:hypothetical protein
MDSYEFIGYVIPPSCLSFEADGNSLKIHTLGHSHLGISIQRFCRVWYALWGAKSCRYAYLTRFNGYSQDNTLKITTNEAVLNINTIHYLSPRRLL